MKSKLPFTSVVSLHTNEWGCGVAKFSKQLAERLGLPFVGFPGNWGRHPLFSLKASELQGSNIGPLGDIGNYTDEFSVFWHDSGFHFLSERASVVYHADRSLTDSAVWCPSLIPAKPRTVKLFSFGMASKFQPEKYRRVKELLDEAGLSFHLRVSVGIHEGTSLSDATRHFDALGDILGADNVTILGILSDAAVVEELHRADYVIAFFEQGLRANNTTVHAALGAGCSVITNHDRETPPVLKEITTDISQMTEWPGVPRDLVNVYSWDNLIANMEEIYARTANRQPTR